MSCGGGHSCYYNRHVDNYLYQKITVPNYKLATPKEYRELMTKENLWKINRKAINLKNYIDVTLIPEKEKI